MALRLVESFLSIQGEGKYQGRLAVFLRFFGCNLRCEGFGVSAISPKTGERIVGCDTIRAVSSHFDAPAIKNANELILIVRNLEANLAQKPIVVITGGEPLLHYKEPVFLEFLEQILLTNDVHFETNGTILVDFEKFPLYKKCYFAISVKLENSAESEQKRINAVALNAIKAHAKDSFYKFVLCAKDSEKTQIDKILAICKNEVWCMPMGADKNELVKNAISVANFAIKHGYNYSERVHIRLWDKKEGV
ncbi:7-carboxy-7-deazaguanine synthase QueE [Campylobacter suis]|uniref:7-carboxy-7-deazaguanine synthase n=1 Tax=Campylobacter suis TaxID=2790657 RepID=A0ABN7K9X3_9BACT|nr:7-carboxy-7-deazaguanine synthase QueE [Campylobacter suis]CAD7288644.1 7-carboxy-7-deazaguanine synthase [Campylobacter suis]